MITSLGNERIKAARKLHSRQHRVRSGRFLLEGVRLIRDVLQSGKGPEHVFYSPESTTHADAAGLLTTLKETGIHCEPVSQKVLDALSQTVTPQGIVAVVCVPELTLSKAADLTLILDGVADPGNAGTMLRCAEAAGADLVIFGPNTVDPFNDKVVRSAMGAHFRLPLRMCASWAEVQSTVASTGRAGAAAYVAEADASVAYDVVDWRVPSVLIVGSEANGPSDDARATAKSIAIPMHGPVESLNAAMAGAVILFEAARQRRNDVGVQR